jgi:hypothetical protein
MADFKVRFDYAKSKQPCSENHVDHFISEQDILERPYRLYSKALVIVDPKYTSYNQLHNDTKCNIPHHVCDLYRAIWRGILYRILDGLHENKEYHIGAKIKISVNPGSMMTKWDNVGLTKNFNRNYPSLELSEVGHEPWGIFFSLMKKVGQSVRSSHRMLLPTIMRGKYDENLKVMSKERYPPQICSIYPLIVEEVAKYPWFDQAILRKSMRVSFKKFAMYIAKGAQISLYSYVRKSGVGLIYRPILRSQLYKAIMDNAKIEWRMNYTTHIDKDRFQFYLGLREDLYRKWKKGEVLTSNLPAHKAEDCHWILYRSKAYCKERYPHIIKVHINKKFFPHIDVKRNGMYDYKFTFIGRFQDFKFFKKVGTRYRFSDASRNRYKNEKKPIINL